jgi:hypothetical protein
LFFILAESIVRVRKRTAPSGASRRACKRGHLHALRAAGPHGSAGALTVRVHPHRLRRTQQRGICRRGSDG